MIDIFHPRDFGNDVLIVQDSRSEKRTADTLRIPKLNLERWRPQPGPFKRTNVDIKLEVCIKWIVNKLHAGRTQNMAVLYMYLYIYVAIFFNSM